MRWKHRPLLWLFSLVITTAGRVMWSGYNCDCIALLLLFVLPIMLIVSVGTFFSTFRLSVGVEEMVLPCFHRTLLLRRKGRKKQIERENSLLSFFNVNVCCPILRKIGDGIRKALLDNLHNGVASNHNIFPLIINVDKMKLMIIQHLGH